MGSKQRILVAIGDVGSVNYLVPVLPALKEEYDVTIVADETGAGRVVLEKASIAHEVWSPRYNLFSRLVSTDIVLAGTAGKAKGLWHAVSEAVVLAGMGPALCWFGDFFGSGLGETQPGYWPDFFAAFDPDTAKLFAKGMLIETGMSSTTIEVVGNPVFDELVQIEASAVRGVARAKAGFSRDKGGLVHYCSSSLAQFDLPETLLFVARWVRSREAFLAVSFHPADVLARPHEVAQLRREAEQIVGRSVVDVDHLTPVEKLAVADVLITDYSSVGVQAAAMGVPTAFILFKSAQVYQRSRGLNYPFFPILNEVEEGGGLVRPVVGVFAESELELLDELVNPTTRQLRRTLFEQHFSALCDGHASARFLEFVRRALACG